MKINRVNVDKIADYIPIVSTVTNSIDLAQKVLGGKPTERISQKSNVRMIVGLIPVVGNCGLAVWDCVRSVRKSMKAKDSDKQINLLKTQSPVFSKLRPDAQDRMIQGLRQISTSSEDLLDVLRIAGQFLENEQDEYKIQVALTCIAQIPKSERDNAYQLARQFFKNETPGEFKASLIYMIGNVPSGERSSFVAAIAPLLMKQVNNDTLFIIQHLSTIKSEERKDIVTHVLQFLKDDGSMSDLMRIVEVIGQIPASDRAQVLHAARPLLNNISNGAQIASILKEVRETAANDRQAVVATTQLFLQSLKKL